MKISILVIFWYTRNQILIFWFITFHTTFIGVKPSCSRFDKINGFIRVYDGTKYLVVFNLEKYNAIFDRIRYFIGVKSDRTYVFLTFM